MNAVKKAATYIQKLPPGIILEVGGHTDDVGQPASNQTLSENRANAVRDALVKFGVNPAVLQTRGYGSTRPLMKGTSDDDRYRNRRIEYSIIKQ
ncbi:MAG: OmpA/MotB family outer membrane protein [Acidobacteria bacterium OLB17]|nr:MAG: OmpA/MotB family outer membrane protein [Acidobacteria bacterium OLB17]